MESVMFVSMISADGESALSGVSSGDGGEVIRSSFSSVWRQHPRHAADRCVHGGDGRLLERRGREVSYSSLLCALMCVGRALWKV